MLTEKIIIDRIEITETNNIQVRKANIIEKDGVEITRTFHRYVLVKGDDLAGQDEKIIAVANAIWGLGQ
jgi:predicted AAA+ superfamily ATPase